MTKRTNGVQPLPPPRLLISREEARKKISMRIELGNTIKSQSIPSKADLKDARSEFYSWDEYNEDMLSRMFDNSSIRDGYVKSISFGHSDEGPLNELIQEFRDDVDYYLRKLASVRDRLELIDVSPDLLQQSSLPSQQRTLSKRVFVVHGHDEGAKEAVARFISKLGLQPIILNEQPNSGKTIIEKLEGAAEEVGFAVVLLTPDDVGYRKDSPEEMRPRARQNVVTELGYFIGKLGRSRVCALHKGDIEIPSDYLGVLYLKMDSNWQILLAQEMRQVIKDIDLNRVFAAE